MKVLSMLCFDAIVFSKGFKLLFRGLATTGRVSGARAIW